MAHPGNRPVMSTDGGHPGNRPISHSDSKNRNNLPHTGPIFHNQTVDKGEEREAVIDLNGFAAGLTGIMEKYDETTNSFVERTVEFTAKELNEALITIFGETAPNVDQIGAEAVAATILNHYILIYETRELVKKALKERNAAKEAKDKEKTKQLQNKLQKAVSLRNGAAHWCGNLSTGDSNMITLKDIVTAPRGQYMGYPLGKSRVAKYKGMKNTGGNAKTGKKSLIDQEIEHWRISREALTNVIVMTFNPKQSKIQGVSKNEMVKPTQRGNGYTFADFKSGTGRNIKKKEKDYSGNHFQPFKPDKKDYEIIITRGLEACYQSL